MLVNSVRLHHTFVWCGNRFTTNRRVSNTVRSLQWRPVGLDSELSVWLLKLRDEAYTYEAVHICHEIQQLRTFDVVPNRRHVRAYDATTRTFDYSTVFHRTRIIRFASTHNRRRVHVRFDRETRARFLVSTFDGRRSRGFERSELSGHSPGPCIFIELSDRFVVTLMSRTMKSFTLHSVSD